jgi:HEAT repeat protein
LLLAYSVEQALDEEIDKGLLKAEEREELKERLSLLAFNMTEARAVSTNLEQAAGWSFKLRELRGKAEPNANTTELEQGKIWFRIWEGCGLLSLQSNEIKFTHQLLQEYFCVQFLQQKGVNSELISRVTTNQFREIWPLWSNIETRLVEILIKISKDKNNSMRYLAEHILRNIATLNPEPFILDLKNNDSEVRRYAGKMLSEIKDARAVEPLILALKDADMVVRSTVADALGEIGDARAVEPLILALKDEDSNVRYKAALALGKIGEPAIEPLILALKDADMVVRSNVADALGEIGDARAVEPLILAFKDEDSNVRYKAVVALGKIGDARAVEPLILALKDEDLLVRLLTAKVLGKIGDARAVEPLILALNDIDSNVRQNAAKALGQIGDARAIEPLILALKEKDEEVCMAAAEAIERIKARQKGQD